MPYRADSIERRFLDGDENAHAIVIRWITQVLTRPRFRLISDEWLDLHQEILQRVVDSLRAGRFDAELDFRVYVQGIARYTARDAVVRRLKPEEEMLGEPEAPTEDPESAAILHEITQTVMEAASFPCREMFKLFFYEQLTHEEIAERISTPVGTVKSRLYRCVRQAREHLRKRTKSAFRTREEKKARRRQEIRR